MNPIVQLGRQVQYSFIALLFASSAVVQSVQAGPNEDDRITNMAEEGDAVPDLGGVTEAAAVGQAANNPNQRVMPINIKEFLRCAGGDVILRGNVVVTFKLTEVGVVWIHSIKFQGFTGTAVAGNRKLQATDKGLKFLHYQSIDTGKKEGRFGFEFSVTGPGLPASSPFRFVVQYSPNVFKYREGKVTDVIWDKASIGACKRLE